MKLVVKTVQGGVMNVDVEEEELVRWTNRTLVHKQNERKLWKDLISLVFVLSLKAIVLAHQMFDDIVTSMIDKNYFRFPDVNLTVSHTYYNFVLKSD